MSAGPAYSFQPGASAGSSCSGSPDFCFLCEFSGSGGAAEPIVGDASLTEQIRGLVHHLASEHKELPTIVEAVSRVYQDEIRELVQWVTPSNTTVRNPDWTRASITRHLLYSSEFNLFTESVENIFHSIILAEQAVVMDPQTGGVHQDAKANLLATMREYANWLSKTRYKAHGTRPPGGGKWKACGST